MLEAWQIDISVGIGSPHPYLQLFTASVSGSNLFTCFEKKNIPGFSKRRTDVPYAASLKQNKALWLDE